MTYSTPSSSLVLPSQPLRSLPLHFSAACLTGALATDIAYWQTAEMVWANFSAWLLTAGLVLGFIAAIAVLIDLTTGRLHLDGVGWLYILGNLAVFVVALFNAFIHSRDAWTSVVPIGLTLSAVAVILMVINAVMGRLLQRQRSKVYVS
ncbi:DUF2231 domain-containing protein [Rhizobium sp. IBUN]|uniref:DUF2231 domain-containing protein n=1 Tax=Rhizobium sp. IBUN TaxID=1042326 RepID=UPI0004030B1F|nr:DUF2231 domain-containing protein [Rhizobium sp. IBUN]